MKVDGELEDARRRFGEPGKRRFGWWETYVQLRFGLPCFRSQRSVRPYLASRWYVFHHGVVVWGGVVQANVALYENGAAPHYAQVLSCPDPDDAVGLDVLRRAVLSMGDLKGSQTDDPELRQAAARVTDEYDKSQGMPVPPQFCSGYDLRDCTVLIRPDHLPGGRLAKWHLPMIVDPDAPHYAFVLPRWYWPKDLVESWLGTTRGAGNPKEVRTRSSVDWSGDYRWVRRRLIAVKLLSVAALVGLYFLARTSASGDVTGFIVAFFGVLLLLAWQPLAQRLLYRCPSCGRDPTTPWSADYEPFDEALTGRHGCGTGLQLLGLEPILAAPQQCPHCAASFIAATE